MDNTLGVGAGHQAFSDLVLHTFQCRVPNCQYPACRGIQELWRHVRICKTGVAGGCLSCKLFHELQLHAQACESDDSQCLVPCCKDLKENLKRSRVQSDGRQPAAGIGRLNDVVKEHLRHELDHHCEELERLCAQDLKLAEEVARVRTAMNSHNCRIAELEAMLQAGEYVDFGSDDERMIIQHSSL